MIGDWREAALGEIRAIKPLWAQRYGWTPRTEADNGRIDLFVHLTKKAPDARGRSKFLLRLRYEPDYQTAGRREEFLDPEDPAQAGTAFWPSGIGAFKPENNPPAICLEGTWGFHSNLHKDRDGRRANLNKLLMEIERCLNPLG